jgi:hypothetical protein
MILGIALVYGLTRRKFKLSRGVLAVAVVLAATYLGAMLIFSFASKDQVLGRGQEKHFCEIDCHIAYSIVDVQQAKSLGDEANKAVADGMFYVVTVKSRFDEKTIGANRGDGPLKPNSRVVTIVDDRGRTFYLSETGQRTLAVTNNVGTELTTPLRPAQSYTTRLVFDLPADVQHPTLLMREGEWLTYFVIGHENSLLHKKTRFQLTT